VSRIRLAFLGTPEFARHHLAALLEDEHYELVGVISQPDRPAGRKMKLHPSPVKTLALEQNLPVLTPAKISEAVAEIRGWKAEAVVVVAYGQILPQSFLDLFPNKVVNVHGSLLPRWRGAAPIQRALMAGDKETGVALQVMVKKLDAGDVLGIRRISLDDDIDAQQLHDQMMGLGADLLHIELMDYLRGHLVPTPQDESLVTYAHKIEKSEAEIDWQQPAARIHNLVRGLAMGPNAFTNREGKRIKILKTEVVPGRGQPGEVLAVTAEDFTIACGQQALKVFAVQPEAKARQNCQAYLKGYPLSQGDCFGSS